MKIDKKFLFIFISSLFMQPALANFSNFEEVQILAGKGNVEAQTTLAMMYYIGHGVSKNYDKAFALFSKSAEQGNVEHYMALH